MPGAKKLYCEKCHKAMDGDEFYSSNNLEKYPNGGKLRLCKKCLTMHVDNWDPETYKWILKEIDVPYIPNEWNTLLARYGKDASKITGTTILGRYLAKMKLSQFKDYRWADTEFLEKMETSKIEQAMKKSGFSAAQIAEAVANGKIPAPERPLAVVDEPAQKENLFDQDSVEELNLNLTEEDKTYLRLKWGKYYKPEEWVRLEQMYEDMMNSYDIQTAGHIDTLKLICKTSLKANQLIDIGDIEGYQRAAKVYDGLMKSGKFTAAQNKAETGEVVDSIAELVALCEKDGFIPRYYVDTPNDKVDRVLQDLEQYTRTLVTEEMNLGNLIDNAVKQIELDKQKAAQENESDNAGDEESFEEQLFSENGGAILTDNDFTEFNEYKDDLAQQDAELLSAAKE